MQRSKRAPAKPAPSKANEAVERRLSRAIVGVRVRDTFVLRDIGWHVVARQLRTLTEGTGRRFKTRQVGPDVEVMRIL